MVKNLCYLVSGFVMTMLVFIGADVKVIREAESHRTYSCRPPVDQGEKLMVTLYEKDGVLTEQCTYYPAILRNRSKDLKDWRKAL